VNGLGYPRRGLHGRVVSELGLRIMAGAWPSGAPLPNEDDLAAELGVSRTVVREAIKVLQAKGRVEVKRARAPGCGRADRGHLLDADVVAWQFADMERGEDLRELYEIRATIETTAARLAAERRTEAQLSEIDAHQRRIEAAAAEPIAFAPPSSTSTTLWSRPPTTRCHTSAR
jgi:DNA-binding FadR family transcriptional regulator